MAQFIVVFGYFKFL